MLRRYPIACLLIALSLIFIASPFTERLAWGRLIDAVLVTVMLLIAVMAVAETRRSIIIGVTLAILPMLGKFLHHFRPGLIPEPLFLFAYLLFIAFILFRLLRFVIRAKDVNSEVLCAGSSIYLVLALIWAIGYNLVERWAPGSFIYTAGAASAHSMQGSVSLYFSLAVMSTGPFGDIVPVSGEARMLAVAEEVVGMFYVAVLIARLVALYSTKSPLHTEGSSRLA